MIPIFKSSVMVNNFLCAGIILQEFSRYTAMELSWLSIGCFICVCGILILLKKDYMHQATSHRSMSYQKDEEEDMREMIPFS